MIPKTKCKNYFRVSREILQQVCPAIHKKHSINSLQAVLNAVVIKFTEVLNAKGALLRILDEETGQFEIRAECGMEKSYLSKGLVTPEKMLPHFMETHQAHVIKDIWNSPRVEYPREAWENGIRMMVDVPIALGDQAVGIIRIYFSDQQDLSDTDLDFIITVADQCACVIERIKYMENQQNKFNQLAIRMEKMSSLGRMAAGIAHEINNPLAGILLYSSNLSKKVPKDGPVKEGLEIIMKETQRCKGIIQDLLEFARDRESEKSEVDVNSIVETAVDILDNEFLCQHVKVEKKLADNMIKINLDKNQIEQVIINLLLNALEAVEANKGMVMIKTSIDQPQNRIYIEIEDNGCGIPHENVENIFDPFFSTKSNGTGLGLSVSYGIIQSHHGEIKVFSEGGQGTRFTIELPIRLDKI